MLVLTGLFLTTALLAALVRSELRAALDGVTLSNGVEVLVSPRVHGEILREYANLEEPEPEKRWDLAVLNVLRPERPFEWRYLAETLGWETAPTVIEPKRVARAVRV